LRSGKTVRVTAPGGTDVTVKLKYQELLPWHAKNPGGNAFLPPAEISEELDPHSVHGVIAADITVGELRFYADLIDPLGLVDKKVIIHVENGLVREITGGDIARRLKAGLDRLDKDLQVVVELGHGLSDLSPTGIIGVDESMNGTCHFGIGNRDPYHVDVVVKSPRLTVSSD
jgi:leucyl aminopeptidase (aminopeptidase T)